MAVAKAVKKLQRQIREKHGEYVGGIMETERQIERSLRPISEPLKKLSGHSAFLSVKKEEQNPLEEEEEEGSVKTENWADTSARDSMSTIDSEDDGAMNTSIQPLVMEIANLQDESAEAYFHAVLTDTKKEIDDTYGVSINPDTGTWSIGNKTLSIDRNSIIVDDVRYVYTPGFFELLFMKRPKERVITQGDRQAYKKILV